MPSWHDWQKLIWMLITKPGFSCFVHTLLMAQSVHTWKAPTLVLCFTCFRALAILGCSWPLCPHIQYLMLIGIFKLQRNREPHVPTCSTVVSPRCRQFISCAHLTQTHLSRIKSVYFPHKRAIRYVPILFLTVERGRELHKPSGEGIQEGLINHWQITAKATSIPIKAGQMQNCNWTTSSFKPTVGLPSYLSKSLLVSSMPHCSIVLHSRQSWLKPQPWKKCLCPQLWCCQPSGIYCKSHSFYCKI